MENSKGADGKNCPALFFLYFIKNGKLIYDDPSRV